MTVVATFDLLVGDRVTLRSWTHHISSPPPEGAASLSDSEILELHRLCGRVQDPYCLRCVPQVHGASRDALAYATGVVETEINSVTDNPLVFPEGDVLKGWSIPHGSASRATTAGRRWRFLSVSVRPRGRPPGAVRGLRPEDVPSMILERPSSQDLDLDHLRAEAWKVRRAIEAAPRAERAGMLVEFPRECCHHGVKLLALHFSGLGLTGLVQASGERRRTGKCHVWLEHRGVIFDITADQFGKSYRPVIVTRRSRWHEAWKPRHEPITEQLLSLWREADPGLYDVYRAYQGTLARLSGIADGASP